MSCLREWEQLFLVEIESGLLIIFANVISERVENIKVMNNFSKLSVFDESSRVGNILHETICSSSSKRLSCRIVFEKRKL